MTATALPPWETYAARITCYYCGVPRGGRPELYGPHECPRTPDMESMDAVHAAVMRATVPLSEHLNRVAHDMAAAFFPGQHRACWACHPERKPKPLAVDGHEYQRRFRARRKRRRS